MLPSIDDLFVGFGGSPDLRTASVQRLSGRRCGRNGLGRLKTAVRKATSWNRVFCKSFSQCFKLCRSRVRSPVGAGRQPSARVRESGCLLTPGYIACESEVPIDLGPAFCITMELVCSLSRDRIIASAIAAAREAELVETFVTNRSY
jgi:hypothetical protein